jgi:hypothetical protein
MSNDEFLGIYLGDQMALCIGWRELAGRAARRSRSTALGVALGEVHRDISADVTTLEHIMHLLGVAPSRAKAMLAIVGERAARFKLNGRILSHSPLSRFEELDVLIMGLDGKATMWTTLRDGAGLGLRLPHVDFGALIDRARAQRATLEPFHRLTARAAMAPTEPLITIMESSANVAPRDVDAEESVDETSRQSFPASDPPPYWARDPARDPG